MPTSGWADEPSEQEVPLIAGRSSGNGEGQRCSASSSSTGVVDADRRRRKPLKATEKMWVIATVSLITFLGYSSQFFILIPYWNELPGVKWSTILVCMIPLNVGLLVTFYNYYLVVFTDPGSVPPDWEPEWEGIGGVEVKASTGGPRYCKVCKSYKPPRAHHCRQCKRCVLRMDHHCPWVANCVGHHNYGHFLRFLYSVNATLSIQLVLLALRVADWWSPMILWREPSTRDMVLLILNFAQGIPVLLIVGIFSLYHTYALCTNTTTIESWEKDKVATLVRRGKIESYKYPYDLGFKRNIQSILGPRMLLWCWPGQPPMGTGLDYALGEGHDYPYQFFWPPRDPRRPQRSREERPSFSNDTGRYDVASAFTYGHDSFNPALKPNSGRPRHARVCSDVGAGEEPSQGGLRKRLSPDETAGSSVSHRPHSRGPPPGLVFEDKEVDTGHYGVSRVSPYHPHFNRSRSQSLSSSASSAEEAGVVDAGCFPPGTIPGTGKRPGDKWREAEEDKRHREEGQGERERTWVDEEGEENVPEEHELLEAKEARRWGHRSGEIFPRLFAENSASEDSNSDFGGSEGDGISTDEENEREQQGLGTEGRLKVVEGGRVGQVQLRSRVRRGSEGYEVRPMMYDHAYARQLEEEEERLREYLMRERERLGTGVKDWRQWSVGEPHLVNGSSSIGGALEERGNQSPEGGGRPLLPSEIMARRAQEVVIDPAWSRLSTGALGNEEEDDDDDDDDYGDQPDVKH